MCNLAGYTGSRQAAPILIEMLRRQEGLDCGFFTGIATMHAGKIYYAKVCGDLEQLLSRTDASSLPGTTGIIHSRTPGKPDDNWAHPFVTKQNGEIICAFVTNGIMGCKEAECEAAFLAHARMLMEEGFPFTSRRPSGRGRLDMGDGTMIHPTEVQAHYTAKGILEGMTSVDAMEHTFTQQKKEGAALLLSLTCPDAITWTRTSFPLEAAFADHGAYIATSPQGFPEDAGETMILPALSSGLLTKESYTCKKYAHPPFTVAPITPEIWNKAYTEITKALKEPCHLYDLPWGAITEAFAPADCTQRNTVVYCVLAELAKKGLLEEEIRRVPHREGELTAPSRYMWLKKDHT